jgi:hypothetical protein
MDANEDLNEDPKEGAAAGDRSAAPSNPGIGDKAELPDPNQTDPAMLPTVAEEIDESMQDTRFGGEHSISPDHAEPTDVTKTTNDNYIEGEYIDVGGGD